MSEYCPRLVDFPLPVCGVPDGRDVDDSFCFSHHIPKAWEKCDVYQRARAESLEKQLAEERGKVGGDAPLNVSLQGEGLVISIGVKTLAFAFENSEENNPYNDDTGNYEMEYRVVDHIEFANDVIRELENEAEDGSSPLTRFLDDMCEAAMGNGSCGLEEALRGQEGDGDE